MKCPIVFASDAAYAMPLATALRSLVDSNKAHWPLEFHVIHDGIAPALRGRIASSIHPDAAVIHWAQIDLAPFARLMTMAGISKMTFARLVIPNVIPESISRVLYLDSDTLTLGDLGALFDVDLGDAPFGAVIDGIDPLIKQGDPRCAGAPVVENYFNAGVLLVDLPGWREHRISQRALEYLQAYPETPFADQDALNVAGNGLWRALDARWNYQKHRDARIDSLVDAQRPNIIHFVTGAKPWRANSLNLNHRLYDRYRSRTAFPRGLGARCSDPLLAIASRISRQLNRFAWWRKCRAQLKGLSTLPRPTTS
jgi:lipopolysaccharide biosynthesis glycosyltransferase